VTATFDVAIAGLGAMGSAAAHCLADRGQRVIAFDRFHPPHDRGSSHGESRIIREAYFEHPVYVPMVQRAYDLWSELERRSGTMLYSRTGGVMIGAPESTLVKGALRSAREHDLAHEVLAAPELRARFPAFAVPDEMIGVVEARAGVLFAERCLRAQVTLAQAAGAEVHATEPVLRWEARGNGVRVFTAAGPYDADGWWFAPAHGSARCFRISSCPSRSNDRRCTGSIRQRRSTHSIRGIARFTCGSSTMANSSTAFRISATASR